MIDKVTVDNLLEYAKDQHNYKEMPEGDGYNDGVVPEQTVPCRMVEWFLWYNNKKCGSYTQ